MAAAIIEIVGEEGRALFVASYKKALEVAKSSDPVVAAELAELRACMKELFTQHHDAICRRLYALRWVDPNARLSAQLATLKSPGLLPN